MVRHMDKDAVKKVIDALKRKPMTWSELKNESGLPEKTLSRILSEYLSSWDLAKKDETGHWIWHEKIRSYSTRTGYELAIDHSRKLVKGFYLLFIEDLTFLTELPPAPKGEEMLLYKEAAEEHLKTGYPEVYDKMIKLLDAVHEKKEIGEELRRFVEKDSLRKLDTLHLVDYTRRFTFIKWAVPKKYRSDVQKLIEKIPKEKVDSTKKAVDTVTKAHLQFISDLNLIIMKIEMGEPLRGFCRLCPEVKIKSHNS